MRIDFDPAAPARNYRAAGGADVGGAPAPGRASFAEVSAAVAAQNETPPPAAPAPKAAPPVSFWEHGDFGFGDLLDTINPLQHLPIVATLYRNMTGDRIGMVPRVVGGALWGRIGGFVSGLLNAAVEWFTGKDIGDHVYALLRGALAPSENLQTARGADSAGAIDEPAETPAAAAHRVARARGPLFTRSAFEDLSVYQEAEAEATHLAGSRPPGADGAPAAPARRLRVSA